MKNRLISAARSAWYAMTEPYLLREVRHDDLDSVPGVWNYGDPLVSVIIPTHNRADLLVSRALPSALAQTYPKLDIIVAMHGDEAMVMQYMRALPNLTEARQRGMTFNFIRVDRRRRYPPTAENHWYAGPVDPINAGLKAAKGKWIARIDDDDEWTPDHIEKLLRFAQHGNYEFVSSAYVLHGRLIQNDCRVPPIGGVQTWLYRSYLRVMRVNPDCWRKKWNKVNDTDLADRFRKAGVRIGWTPEVTAHVQPRPGESTVGLKAYTRDRAETERRLAFN